MKWGVRIWRWTCLEAAPGPLVGKSRISPTPPSVNSEFPETQEVVCWLSGMHHMRLTSQEKEGQSLGNFGEGEFTY
jgi:hypothetical protein